MKTYRRNGKLIVPNWRYVYPRIINGDCLTVMQQLADEGIRFDSIVTDPPYHLTTTVNRFGKASIEDENITSTRIKTGADGYARNAKGFMGKTWDGGDVALRVDTWRLAYALLKPGAYLVAFGGTRTFHRMACAIEDAGFELRDTIMWLHGQGFPKSHNVSKGIDKAAGVVTASGKRFNTVGQDNGGLNARKDLRSDHPDYVPPRASSDAAIEWDGWGSALKPAFEPVLLFRKPLSGTIAKNVQVHGTGALNIEACRIATGEKVGANGSWGMTSDRGWNENSIPSKPSDEFQHRKGRWPANVAHDGSDEVIDMFAAYGERKTTYISKHHANNRDGLILGALGHPGAQGFNDAGSAARFFYCAKASAAEKAGSKHPTIKPVALMQWLVRMVTPPGGLVLDPFAGSGTTIQAAYEEGLNSIAIEMEEQSVADCKRRMASVRYKDMKRRARAL